MPETIIPVTLSKKAIDEVRNIMQTKNIPRGYGLRVGVRGGLGCGATLVIGFDQKTDSDIFYTIEDIPVYMDKRHTLFLIGKEVDFYEGADARGFVFVDTNPKS
jgi:iron-sulfur cluster assembly protein